LTVITKLKKWMKHLIKEPIRELNLAIPFYSYPDQEKTIYYKDFMDEYWGWNLEPMTPYLEGEIVFLIYLGTIRYAESIANITKNYRLA
jgi:hypothetical protein